MDIRIYTRAYCLAVSYVGISGVYKHIKVLSRSSQFAMSLNCILLAKVGYCEESDTVGNLLLWQIEARYRQNGTIEEIMGSGWNL